LFTSVSKGDDVKNTQINLKIQDNERRRYEQAVEFLVSDVKQVLVMMGQEYVTSLPLLCNLKKISFNHSLTTA